MTITLYLSQHTLLRDLQTIQTILDAGTPELVIPLNGFLQPLEIVLIKPQNGFNNIPIQVTTAEFALIGCFQPNLINK